MILKININLILIIFKMYLINEKWSKNEYKKR